MRELVHNYLQGRLSRRGFFDGMAKAGFTAAAAAAVLEPLDASEQAASTAREDAPPAPAAPAREAAASHTIGTTTMKGTGGELVVAQAKAAGVEFLFANPGSMEVGFYDALVDEPGIHFIMGLHEGIVISMADGFHKVSGKPAFVNLHMAAGTAQASGQLYNASRDGTAMIVTAGLNDNQTYNDDLILSPRPGYDQRDIVRQWTKMSNEARTSETLPLMVRRAFKMATTEPGGPVYLALLQDALEKKNVEAQILPAERFLIRPRLRPEAAATDEAARLLIEAKQPVLLVGDDVWNSGAQDELLKFAERFGLPVAGGPGATAFQNFPPHHQQWIGNFDLRSDWLKRGCDLMVIAGCRNDFGGQAVPQAPMTPEGAKIVRIGMDTMAMGRTTPTDLALVGDVKASLQELKTAVESRATKSRLDAVSKQRIQELRAYSSDARKRADATTQATLGNSPMHAREVGAVMARTLGNAIIVSENLTAVYDAFPFGYRENEPIWVTNSGHGLGWGIGASTGAKLAAPNRLVVCSIGDGSVMYSASGFWTQVRSGIPVLTVVWNNRNYQTVRQVYYDYKGKMASTGHYPGMHLGDPDIDFVKLAESQGVKGAKANTAAELEAALKKGMAASRDGKSFLVDASTSCWGGGAESTWYERYNFFESTKRKA
jgi:thiamine pyrophosphate-dependent acetolactate synthase large subunit-like protein